MRRVIDAQLKFGQVNIPDIKFDLKSRDDIPQVLKGLQYMYVNQLLRGAIFFLLEKYIVPKSKHTTGRPGLCLWNILVMGGSG